MTTTFFYLSKILWFFANPFHLVMLLAFISLLTLYLKWYRTCKLFLTVATLTMITMSIYPVGDLVLSPLEKRFPRPQQLPEKVDGIIILGGSIKLKESAAWETMETNGSAERILKGAALAKAYPEAKLVFTGGSGLMMDAGKTEAAIAELMLLEQGIESNRIILEDKSRNTYQNATLTKEILSENISGNWILVTSAFHMPRSVGVFRGVGWKTIPFPVDYKSLPSEHRTFRFDYEKNMRSLAWAMHEWIGLAAYYYTGKSAELFPH